MTSKERMLAALSRETPDRLPVTTHHVMPYYLETYLGGLDVQGFFDRFQLDPICWLGSTIPNPDRGEYHAPHEAVTSGVPEGLIVSNDWRVSAERVEGLAYPTTGLAIETPSGTLSLRMQQGTQTSWLVERPIKEKKDIDILAAHLTQPICDVDAVNREAAAFGRRGLVRGAGLCFDLFGQPGCWQDAACLVGIEKLCMAALEDPPWVHCLLDILLERKLTHMRSTKGACFDVIELGGGDASSTVISPQIFEDFVAPYDGQIVAAAHEAGQRVAYHTCGGMMPLLDMVADMGVDAMETFTPAGMGGDVDLAEAKARIGDRVCMIGGFDQFHFFLGCTPKETRAEVRRCFEAAGEGGGFILCPSDHFFDADTALLEAFGDEGGRCIYS